MSLMTASALERNMHILHINLQDLKNEIQSVETIVEQLHHDLSIHTTKLQGLQQRLSEKSHLLRMLEQIQSFRREEIRRDHDLQLRVVYGLRCLDYLRTYSTNVYYEHDLMTDEAIEYAHKLHFVRCLQQWSVQEMSSDIAPIEHPKDEQDYYPFELTHALDERHIFLCSPTAVHRRAYAILHEQWHQLYDYANSIPFTIDSHASIIPSIVRCITVEASSPSSEPWLC